MSEKKRPEAQLTVRGEVNHPYLLQCQIQTIQSTSLIEKGESKYAKEQWRRAIQGEVGLIPDVWKGEKFKKEVEAAKHEETIDLRPFIVSGIRMDEETCKELGIPAFKKKTVFDSEKMFQACTNLLHRRKMLGKVNPVEEIAMIELERLGEAEAAKAR